MDHPTTSSLLTWITFMPLIGAALILPVLALRASGALTKAASDQACRVIAMVASGLTLLLALGLWRGRAWAGFDGDLALAEASRLEEARLSLREERAAALLDVGR